MNIVKRILVTGGVEFIGSHFCGRFLQAGAGKLYVNNLFCSTKKIIEYFKDKV